MSFVQGEQAPSPGATDPTDLHFDLALANVQGCGSFEDFSYPDNLLSDLPVFTENNAAAIGAEIPPEGSPGDVYTTAALPDSIKENFESLLTHGDYPEDGEPITVRTMAKQCAEAIPLKAEEGAMPHAEYALNVQFELVAFSVAVVTDPVAGNTYTAGEALPTITVEIRVGGGQRLTGASHPDSVANVHLSFPDGSPIDGTVDVPASDGRADFSGLSIGAAATDGNYELTFTVTNARGQDLSVDSGTFSIGSVAPTTTISVSGGDDEMMTCYQDAAGDILDGNLAYYPSCKASGGEPFFMGAQFDFRNTLPKYTKRGNCCLVGGIKTCCAAMGEIQTALPKKDTRHKVGERKPPVPPQTTPTDGPTDRASTSKTPECASQTAVCRTACGAREAQVCAEHKRNGLWTCTFEDESVGIVHCARSAGGRNAEWREKRAR